MIGAAVAAGCGQGAALAETLAKPAPAAYDAIIAKHSRATGVPEQLIRRIIVRESKYNPNARNGGHYGMMQIKPATAKSMGYRGDAAGLLDADVNLTYGVRYLAGAYKVAGGNQDRAVRLYASGYYYDAKRRGMLADVGLGRDGKFKAGPITPESGAFQLAAADAPAEKPNFFMFGRTQAKLAEPAAQANASAPAIPLPPVRGGLSPVVAKAAVPTPPVPPFMPGAIASNAVPLPPSRDAAKPDLLASAKRVVAPDVQPVFASAVPVPPSKPKAPTVALAASGPVVPLPPSRAADVDVTGSVKR